MKKILIVGFLLVATLTLSSQENYKLIIDGQEYSLGIDQPKNLKINKEEVLVELKENDVLLFSKENMLFSFPKEYKVVKTEVEDGLTQFLLMTASGSGVIVQKYNGMNPAFMGEMMINEVTKESKSYGYKSERLDYDRKLSSGQQVQVLKEKLTYKETETIYEVAAFGKKEEGVVVMTVIADKAYEEEGYEIIDLFWKTFKY